MPPKHLPQVLDASKGLLCHLRDQRALDFAWPISPDPAAVTCCLAVLHCAHGSGWTHKQGAVGKLEESAEELQTCLFCKLTQQL